MNYFLNYSNWNRALYKYFFPNGNENPILYLDEDILKKIAEENKIDKCGKDLSDNLFSCTLISSASLSQFFSDLVTAVGNPNIAGIKDWNGLVGRLKGLTLSYIDQNANTKVPAYFAMLCSIMLLASRNGADHRAMNNEARQYLSVDRCNPGTLIDELMQQLHRDFPDFDPDRMVGGQRHMGRIKYHLVLNKAQRDNFIDFIEVNNLRWECSSFESFVNDILVPALDNAGKKNLSIKVTQGENIPYFKNILCDSNLRWGKETSEFNNQIQEKVFKWKYECRFDYDGKLWFNIYFDYHLPFGLCLKEGKIAKCETPNNSEYIAKNLDTFPIISSSTIEDNSTSYRLCNVNDDHQDQGFYFEAIGDDFYRQVDFPEEGKEYYVFLSDKDKPQQEWENDTSFILNGYSAYKIGNYQRQQNRRVDNNNGRLKDKFNLVQCGSFFSINLEDGQELWWKPNKVNEQGTKLDVLCDGKDSKKYFRIEPSNKQGQCLSGSLFVKSGNDTILSEQITAEFKWTGSKRNYHLDSWGRAIDGKNNSRVQQDCTLPQKNIEKNPEPTPDTGMLLQILHDIADENGCIYGRKISDALDFVLSNFGISPTIERRKSILYALRWLGCIIADYDINKRDYVNQLIPKYIEKSGYSVSHNANAYILKGTYGINERDELIKKAVHKLYLRPYDEETLKKYPEYRALPDTVILEGIRESPDWVKIENPIAHQIISDMKDMKEFSETFSIDNNGDQFHGNLPETTPSMVEYNGDLVLCTERSGVYFTHKYYRDNNIYRFIPKSLAKTYVQNAHNSPICVMGYGDQVNKFDYSRIYFFSEIDSPDLLKIALCDLNLGMPTASLVFIVNKDSLKEFPSQESGSGPITKMFKYNTTATLKDHETLANAVRKLSGRSIVNNDLTNCPEIVFTIKEDSGYRMIMSKDSHYTTLFLYENEQFQDKTLVAFSIGSRVYYRRAGSSDYHRVVNEGTVNSILSQIINGNGKKINVSSDETKTPPQHLDSHTIKIIKKHNIKQS